MILLPDSVCVCVSSICVGIYFFKCVDKYREGCTCIEFLVEQTLVEALNVHNFFLEELEQF
jgi:hypothetical protein